MNWGNFPWYYSVSFFLLILEDNEAIEVTDSESKNEKTNKSKSVEVMDLS